VLPDMPASAQKHLRERKKKLHLPNCIRHHDDPQLLTGDDILSLTVESEFNSAQIPSESTRLTNKEILVGDGKERLEEDIRDSERVYNFNNCQFTYLRPEQDEGLIADISSKELRNATPSDHKSIKQIVKVPTNKSNKLTAPTQSLTDLFETINYLNKPEDVFKMSVSELIDHERSQGELESSFPAKSSLGRYGRSPLSFESSEQKETLSSAHRELSHLFKELKIRNGKLKIRENENIKAESMLNLREKMVLQREKDFPDDISNLITKAIAQRDSVIISLKTGIPPNC
jgi:hypothetical protein